MAPQLHIAEGGNLVSMAEVHPEDNFWPMSVDGDPLASAYSGEELRVQAGPGLLLTRRRLAVSSPAHPPPASKFP